MNFIQKIYNGIKGRIQGEKSFNEIPTAEVRGNTFTIYGETATKKLFSSNWVIYRGINMLAQNIAALPFHLYKGDKILEEGTLLPNFDLYNPNIEMSFYEMLHNSLVYYFYKGELMIWKNFEGSRLTLEPINPSAMVWNDRRGVWIWNGKKTIDNEELIYLKLLNPDLEQKGSNRGLSPVDVVREEVLSDIKAIEFNKKFFENFGKVGGIIYDNNGVISTEDMKNVVNQFNSAHASSSKAYKTLGLPYGLQYTTDSQTLAEMQFLESRREIRDKIMGVLGIHKHLFGVTDKVDRANAREARKGLWLDTLKPAAIMIQEEFNRQLFKKHFPEYSFEFNFNSVEELKADKTERLKQAKIYRELGYTTNEINETLDLGMDDITDEIGNMRFVPNNIFNSNENKEKSNKNNGIDKVIDVLFEIDNIQTKEQEKQENLSKFNNIQNEIIKIYNKKLRGYFSKQLGKVLGAVKQEGIINRFSMLDEIHKVLLEENDKLLNIIHNMFDDLNEKFDKNVKKDENLINRCKELNNHTYFLIKKQIEEGFSSKEDLSQIHKRIVDVYKFNTSQAKKFVEIECNKIIKFFVEGQNI